MKFKLSLSHLIKSEVKLKIIKFLLTHEAAMSEREIASILKISHMGINRTMRELAELNLVHYTVVGKAHLWKVNRNSFAYKMFDQLIQNAESLIDPLIELKQIILKNLPMKFVERVVIFGSISSNSEKPNSDIDVFILVKTSQHLVKVENSMDKLSNQCLEIFGNRFSPYILTKQQLNQKKNLKIISAVNKGIQIYPHEKAQQ